MKSNSKQLKTIITALIAISVLLTGCSTSVKSKPVAAVNSSPIIESNTGPFINRLNGSELGLVREVPASSFKSSSSSVFENRTKSGSEIADARGLNCNEELTAEQQSKFNACIPHIIFNDDTIFPENMPASYDPEAIMEAGKNPGLGVRLLHEDGVNGSGVGIAIIDQVLYTGHPEYKDQLAYYEEIHVTPSEGASMHGSGVSSIAVGKNCGVAPGAKLYYWAVNLSKDINNTDYSDAHIAFAEGLAVAIDRVLEVNKTLPEKEKIRVISISRGFSNLEDEGVKAFLAAVKRAEAEGIFVITTRTFECYDWLSAENDFAGLGKADYTGDPDKLSTYTLGVFEQRNADKYISKLLVPMDARTTADFTGDGYVFYCDGGWSWVAPYLAGVYALACQVKPSITPEEFWNTALDTADPLAVNIQTTDAAGNSSSKQYTFQHVINPVKLIQALSNG